MSSPALSAGGLGLGLASGTGIGTSLSAGRRGAALDGAVGGSNASVASEVVAHDGSAPPSIGVPSMANGHDISPGSVSSYVSSDLSSPATPGSTEDLFAVSSASGTLTAAASDGHRATILALMIPPLIFSPPNPQVILKASNIKM